MKEDKMRSNVEVDRLSSLPDELIHKILSFIGITCAIRTSSLSSRWRFVWTSMPYLNFSVEDFHTMSRFYKFVTDVVCRRNNQIEVFSVKLSFCGKLNRAFVDMIMNYVFSHNVQQLSVTCLNEENSMFAFSLFTSQSLKHLSFTNSLVDCSITPTSTWDLPALTSTWDLPALTTLHVSHVKSWDRNYDKCFGLFSTFANLKNLTFNHLHVDGLGVLSFCHPRLSNLTLEHIFSYEKVFDVVAPHLENLTIKDCSMKCRISAPDLSYFHYEGYHPLQFSTDGFHSLEKVSLYFRNLPNKDAPSIVSLLQQVHTAKLLILNSEIVELLSSSAELLSHVPSPFAKLKSLKIYPLDMNEELDKKVTMSTEVRNYLLDNSPNATITIVSRKEIWAAKNSKLAQKLMKALQVLLRQWKANSETNMAHMERGKASIESHKTEKMQVGLVGSTTQMKSYWEELGVQIEQGKSKTCDILSRLLQIEELLAKLPASQRAEIQPRFSSLCGEAHSFVNNILCELATTSQPSS